MHAYDTLSGQLNCAGRKLDLGRCQIMGILNVTPDSFSDGGCYVSRQSALEHARHMSAAGAAIIDVGGESTRPGAAPVSLEEELTRVVPVIEAIKAELPVIISVDTSKPEVMKAAVAAGASMINDVRALQADGALDAVAQSGAAVCLMHMRGEPAYMQQAPAYHNVVEEVQDFLTQRVDACLQAGIRRERLVIDPGFGFGKTLTHNLQIFKNLNSFVDTGWPVMIGVSRKSMIGTILNVPVEDRLIGSISLAALAAWQGVSIIRVHDVAETFQAVSMCMAVRHAN